MDLNDFFSTTIAGIEIGKPLLFCAKAFIIYLFTQIVVWIVNYLFRHHFNKNEKALIDKNNAGFFRRIIVYAIYLIGITAFLALIPGMEKVSNSILAGAGIVAMAVGLASQEALKNIVSGMFIVFSRPFRIGDYIQVGNDIAGTVKEITLRHTVIQNSENRTIIVPNSTMNTATIINSTIGDQTTCAFVEIGVSYDTNLDKAIKAMREEIQKHPLLIDRRSAADKKAGTEQVIIRVINLGDSAITLKAWAWASSSGNAFILKCDLYKSVKERFDAEKIEIPYPYFNQIIKQEA